MLTLADTDLVKRDPALPGLAILLDANALLGALQQAHPDINPGKMKATYVRYKHGMNCLVAYQLQQAGAATQMMYAKIQGHDAGDKLGKAHEQARRNAPFGIQTFVLAEHAIVVRLFPADSKLNTGALRRLIDPASRKKFLRRLLPQRSDLWKATIESLRYKPERRYVTRLRNPNEQGDAVLKIYTQSGYHAARIGARAFASSKTLRIPMLLEHCDKQFILVFDWQTGQQLVNVFAATPELASGMLKNVGMALAELHAQSADQLPVRTRQAEADNLSETATAIAAICPHLATRAADIAHRLGTRLLQMPPLALPLHGDFYADQVLLKGDTVCILDLDRASRGDPGCDLGRFIAQLERDVLHGDLPVTQVKPLQQALLDGYRTISDSIDLPRITLYTATALFQLAMESFRYRKSDWPQQIKAILARTEALIQALPSDSQHHSTSAESLPAPHTPTIINNVSVTDPFQLMQDPTMAFLAPALDPHNVEPRLQQCLSDSSGEQKNIQLQAIRVSRHKPARRCVIEYDVVIEHADLPPETITLIGKARVRGLDKETYALQQSLWRGGFATDCDDGICVAEPFGVIPHYHMWLYYKVPGVAATHRLAEAGGVQLAQRIAQAAHKLHQCRIPSRRRHAITDELDILHKCLMQVSTANPHWASRITRLLDACDRLGATLPETVATTGIHRDFYADQVLVNSDHIYLIDLDMYCEGDPGLDIGNFIAHITEYSLRTLGDPEALLECEQALAERFLQLSGKQFQHSMQVYADLSLVRHIYLSTQFPERQAYTESLLVLCEQRLNVAKSLYRSNSVMLQ